MTAAAAPVARHAELLSVVVPLYNEAAVLDELVQRVTAALRPLGTRFEVILVNDGSRDGSADLADTLAGRYPEVAVVHLSRNFGHQAAVQAGLCHARGDAVIVMDADLQDDPAALPGFIADWEQGWDVVYAIRAERKEGPLKRLLFSAFYRFLRGVANTRMPLDAGNFGLVDRRVCELITALPESDRYYSGLRAWVGFRQKGVAVERQSRYDGRPRVSTRGLFRLAQTAIFSFSSFPLRFFYFVSFVSMVVCVGVSAFALYHHFFTGLAIPGWTSYLVTVSFFGALNALGISVLGEYVIRIYDQVRQRPTFVVARTVKCAPPPVPPAGPPAEGPPA